jgi:succinoglycan biosynthesis protein ExoA
MSSLAVGGSLVLMQSWPDVAVVMPVLNEEKHLANAVSAILEQNYAGNLHVVLALGPSQDATEAVATKLATQDQRVTWVPNPSGRTPEALNAAIAATTESVIVRVDAHCELSDGYITEAIETLERTRADNVGGIMGAEGSTPFQQAVATAMTSALGVGSASFHVGGEEGPAETVYLGVFRRSALERVGGYDPAFTRAQDWEMNFRIRSSGGLIWFNPNLYVTYHPRSSLRALAKQYFDYGSWRHELMRAHPETVKAKSALRYFAPPTALVGVFCGTVLGCAGLLSDSQLLTAGFVAPLGYFALTILSTGVLSRKARTGARWLPLVLMTMQLSWGAGFITSRKQKKN